VTEIVVADTGPLIALARGGHLQLLQTLYEEIIIPPAVHTELCLGSGRPGSKRLADAVGQGWLQIKSPSASATSALDELTLILDPGEAAAIVLAEEMDCRFLLIDERKGRAVARRRGVPIAGIAGVLLAAKKHGFIDEVLPLVNDLEQIGYRMSPALISEIARRAGESGV
jgi:predicted nucleic acid-binding protein